MGHAKPVRLETASTGGESVYLFLEFTIINYENVHRSYALDFLSHVKRRCKTRIKIVGAGSPRPQSVRVGGPNPYEDSVAVARFLNMNRFFYHLRCYHKFRWETMKNLENDTLRNEPL